MLALQLGTSKIKLYKKGSGIVYSGATVVAFDKSTESTIAIGNEALSMIERAPDSIEISTPVISGTIYDYSSIKMIVSSLIETYAKEGILKPNLLIVIPGGLSNLDKKTIIDIACYSGANRVSLIESTVASAFGTMTDIRKPFGNLVIDIGAGTTDIAAVSMSSVVYSNTLKIGGNDIDESIIQYIRKNKNLIIGRHTAERIKNSIGYATTEGEEIEIFISGKSTITDLPETFGVTSTEINEAITPVLDLILKAIREVLDQLPEQMYIDICSGNIIVAGGVSRLINLKSYLESHLNIPVTVSADGENTAIKGAGYLLDKMNDLDDRAFLFKLRHIERFMQN